MADTLDIRPTKTLGQNFVIDPNTVRRIVAAAHLKPHDTVVEIGPGLGSLTLALAETGAQVTAVEIDPRLAEQLPTTFQSHAPEASLRVITKDAMHVTAEEILHTGHPAPTALVANLPYNVAVPVLLHMLDILPSLRTTVVMVQAEVADRLAATPGSRIYGVPSVKANFYGTVSRAGAIGRNVFWPAPNVDWTITDAAFAQRRKTLRAALKPLTGSGEAAEHLLKAAGIDPTLRGERLTAADYVRLAQCGASLL